MPACLLCSLPARSDDPTTGCRIARIIGILGFALVLLAGTATTPRAEPQVDREQDGPTGKPADSDPAQPVEIPYEVSFSGVEDDTLLAVLEGSSQLLELVERPPATLTAIERRAQGDKERLVTALHSEGYYDSTVAYRLDSDARPVAIEIEVTTGPLYHLAEYEILYQGSPAPAPEDQPALAAINIVISMPARAPAVQASQAKLLQRLAERGYPLAKVVEREALVFRDDSTMAVTLSVDAGPRASFGSVTVTGVERVEEDYVRRLLPWREGDLYDQRKVDEARRALSQTGLFTGVSVRHAEQADPEGALPMTLELSEAARRSFGFGANYSTDVGIGGEIFWEHRNIFGEGESLRAELVGSKIEQSATLLFRKPDFPERRQALVSSVAGTRAETDAFDERSIAGFVGLETPMFENWLVTAGVSAEFARLKDEDETENVGLFGLPLTGVRDDTDDPLNPSRGTRLNLSATPYIGTAESSQLFVSSVAGGSAYYAVDSEARYILAGRARLGSIVGESTKDLPANKRFYAGGGGSVRGYEFQKVGPLDNDDDPLGGRSLIEVGAELRVRVTETIGVVPFVDGGTVYDSSYPDFDETFRWAAGLGVRYFTGFGPIRLDVAVPLNKRDDVDNDFEFYISFGQAF